MMAAKGLAKLIEECGELLQVAGKKLAYYKVDEHPDGGPPLRQRLEDEIADVQAACELVLTTLNLNRVRIDMRRAQKLALFNEWHARKDNNEHAVDAPEKR